MGSLAFGLSRRRLIPRPRPGRRGPKPSRRQPLVLEPLESRDLLTGTWTPLAHLAPSSSGGIGTMMLLSDGTVMAQGGGITNTWYHLTPDASGSYLNGTWSQLPSMHDTRLYFPSQVLLDGRVFVAGGEYGSGTSTGEIYDPYFNYWGPIPNRPLGDIGDVPSEALPDGRVIVGYRNGGQTNIYDPWANTWSVGPTKLRGTTSSEESWVQLPDQSILTYEIYSAGGIHAQRFVPYLDTPQWVDAGTLPFSLQAGLETGPALLLPDGRAFFAGANGRTALYTPGAGPLDPGSWAAGPTFPNGLGAFDAPGAMMPNGNVLLAVGPQNYGSPTYFYEYDPVANTLTRVTSPPGFTGPSYVNRMLMLPDGNVLVTYGGTQLWEYSPDGAPDPSWQPVVSGVYDDGDGTFFLTGTQLTGLSEGAAYGDDAEMSSNYPIVELVDDSGNAFFARTLYWSSTGVAQGDTPQYTFFIPPDGLNPGDYSLYVITNGIASDPVPFTFGGNQPGIKREKVRAELPAPAAPVQATPGVVPAPLAPAATPGDIVVRSAALGGSATGTPREGLGTPTVGLSGGEARRPDFAGQAAAGLWEASSSGRTGQAPADASHSGAAATARTADQARDLFFIAEPLDGLLI